MTANPDKQDKFLLIDKETKTDLGNVSELFKDKFVFYSPKITTAVDFSIDTPQDVVIYIKGMTINPDEMFQQATRTRNIQTLYYYSAVDEPKDKKKNQSKKAVYNNIDDLEQLLHNNLEVTLNSNSHSCNQFKDACISLDADDNIQMVEKTFYKILVYN